MKIGNREFEIGKKTYVMGIINVTPDSFSDGGMYNTTDLACKRIEQMLSDSADIIDIGGESTRPGYQPVSAQEQIERVIPVIEKVKQNFDVPISVDTYNADVAKEAIAYGVDLINDIWALQSSEKMASVIAQKQVCCCLMHNRHNANYNDFLTEMLSDIEAYLADAQRAGIPRDKIIIDPGVGFGKTYEQNLSVINHLDCLKKFDLPILLGTSRKSVIGLTLDLPIFERVEGTIATTVIAVMKGASFVRVHDVKENVRAIRMTEAILYS
ncbi:MAG: dihydropteroate synthase [Lachnospiraceae bacterium]|nr:dihydropteroate synthase [Lachnospiraceae bacterium]